jgi:hypothetical protein
LASDTDITITVSDTGVGMAPEDLERIFLRFEQLEEAPLKGEKGSGLGLSICKALVELHGGDIRAESEGRAKGSRFVIRLPRLTPLRIFAQQAKRILEESAAQGANASVFSFHISGTLSSGQLSVAMDILEMLVREQQGKREPLLIKNSPALYAVVTGTVRREALRVRDKLLKAFTEKCAQQKLPSDLWLTSQCGAYPEDGGDVDSFLSRFLGGVE